MAVLAGTDFFTVEVLTWRGLVTYYVLFFLHLETQRVTLAGITRHPTEIWITQMGRNAVHETAGAVRRCHYLLHDRDAKFAVAFQDVFASEGIRCLRPTANSKSERICGTGGPIREEECLSHLILFGERSLHRAVTEFVSHFHSERNHQSTGTLCSSPPQLRLRLAGTSAAENALVACFDNTAGPLEIF